MYFVKFPKIPRLSRDCCITEKIDGSLGQINIRFAVPYDVDNQLNFEFGYDTQVDTPAGMMYIRAGSKNQWIDHGTYDHFEFGAWVYQNAHELIKLGPGAHFGEVWGVGIQRGYGQPGRRFSLLNTGRWAGPATRPFGPNVIIDINPATIPPVCCDVVPTLYVGPFNTTVVDGVLSALAEYGSVAAPGFMDPEGVVIYHTALDNYFKKTIKNDFEHKGASCK